MAEAQVTVTVEAAEPQDLHEVRIAGPDSARVGERVSHTAEVVDQHGQPVAGSAVDWDTTGVGVHVNDSDGRAITVTPQEAGEYALIAREIAASPPAPDTDPNQWPPEGDYSQLLPEVTADRFPDGWLLVPETQSGRSTLTLEDGNPITGGNVIRATFGRGYRGGGHTAHMVSPRFRPSRELVIDEVLRISSNFVSHPSGINKLWFTQNYGNPGGGNVNSNVGILYGGLFRPSWVSQGDSAVDHRITSGYTVGHPSDWLHVRWRIRMDADAGLYTIWAAPYGSELMEVGHWEDRPSAAPAWDLRLDSFQIRPIWGGTGSEIAEDQHIEWARLRIAGR